MCPLAEIAQDEVHVHLVDPRWIEDAELLARYDALMSEAERARQRRFVRPEDRLTALITRALVRTTLSRYAAVEPSAWVFSIGEHGKPEIANSSLPLRFNLSHTTDLVACAVTLIDDVGVDVEWTSRPTEIFPLAESMFSPVELAALRALPEDAQRRRFCRYWTLKEAYIKARGMGLALPLREFSFVVDQSDDIEITFSAGITDDPAAWQFAERRPTDEHALALALRRAQPRAAVRLWRVIPLVDTTVWAE